MIVARSVVSDKAGEVASTADFIRIAQTASIHTAQTGGVDISNFSAARLAAATASQYGHVSEAAVSANIAANAAVAEDIWESVRFDAADLETESDISKSYNKPLWQKEPHWWQQELAALKRMLLNDDMKQGAWDVLLDWYDTVSQGKPAFGLKDIGRAAELEKVIALGGIDGKFHKEFWDREPGLVNHDVAEWVAQARVAEILGAEAVVLPEANFPAQSIDATMFGLNAKGQIDRVAIPPEQQLQITPLQQRQYAILRDDAEALYARGQILGKLGAEIADLIAALPLDMTHAGVFDVWRAINRLRRTMNAHARVVEANEPHEAKLEISIAEELGFLLDTANNFTFDDPGLRRRDEQSIPPQDKQSVADEKAIGDLIAQAALNEPEMFTLAALEVVKADERNAETAGDDAHGLQAIDQTNKTRRNWFATIISVFKGESGFAWKEMRSGVYKKTGELGALAFATDVLGWTTIYSSIWNFVLKHGSSLLAYVKSVYNNPTLTTHLEHILKLAGF